MTVHASISVAPESHLSYSLLLLDVSFVFQRRAASTRPPVSTPLNIFYCLLITMGGYYMFWLRVFIQLRCPNGSLTSCLIDYLPSKMPLFLYVALLLLGLHCAPPNSSEGKVTTCHSPQQNGTLYTMSSINADFAFNLYRRFTVETPDRNIFLSPVSISAALAMLSLGARSSTQTQILESLGFNLTDTPVTEIEQGFQHLICSLNFPKEELELQMGNALFIGKQLKPLAKFLNDVNSLYETEVFSTDFSNVSIAQQEINSHVEKQTKGKVVGIIQDLKSDTIMVLVNYIHFKGTALRYAFRVQCSCIWCSTGWSSWSLLTGITRYPSYQ